MRRPPLLRSGFVRWAIHPIHHFARLFDTRHFDEDAQSRSPLFYRMASLALQGGLLISEPSSMCICPRPCFDTTIVVELLMCTKEIHVQLARSTQCFFLFCSQFYGFQSKKPETFRFRACRLVSVRHILNGNRA